MLALGGEERGGGGGCSRLLRAAGGVGSGTGHDPAGTTVTRPWHFFTTAVKLLCIFHEAVTDAALRIRARVALSPRCFMVRLSVISRP